MELLSKITTANSKLQFCEIFKKELEEFLNRIKSIEVNNSSLSSVGDSLKHASAIFLTFLNTKSDQLKDVKLKILFDQLLDKKDPISGFKSLFESTSKILKATKCENATFTEIQNSFSFHSIFFTSLLKFTKIDFTRSLDNRSVKIIWLVFLSVSRISNVHRLDKRMDFLCALIFKHMYQENDSPENLNTMNLDFKEHLSFQLEYDEYLHCRQILNDNIPDFNPSFFEFESLQDTYLDSLNRLEIDLLVFYHYITTDTMSSIIQTPIQRKSMSLSSPNNKFIKMCGQAEIWQGLSIHSVFSEVVDVYKSPKGDQSILKDKLIPESKDHSRELAGMIQWFKKQVKSVNLLPLMDTSNELQSDDFAIESEMDQTGLSLNSAISFKYTPECYYVSTFFKPYANNPIILENLQQALKIIQIKAKDDSLPVTKFFFSILDKLISKEALASNLSDIQTLVKEKNFLNSVVCFTLELNSSINKSVSRLKFEEVIELCKCGYIDVWKIIYVYTKSCGRDLPLTLKMRVHEIEIDILFKNIWTAKDNKRCLAFSIFSSTTVYSDLSIKRILRIMAERLYILTTELQLTMKLREMIWGLIKKLMFYGLDNEGQDLDISFKTNVHMDFLLLSSFYHVVFINNQYINMKSLIPIYSKKVTFPVDITIAEFKEYYTDVFKKKMKGFSQDPLFNCKVVANNDEAKNSTPIQTSVWQRKNLILKTAFECTLPVTLEKRDIDQSGIPLIPQFSSEQKLKLPKYNMLSDNESPKNFGQTLNLNTFPIPFVSSNNTALNSPLFFSFPVSNSNHRGVQPEEDNSLMDNTGIQTPTFK